MSLHDRHCFPRMLAMINRPLDKAILAAVLVAPALGCLWGWGDVGGPRGDFNPWLHAQLLHQQGWCSASRFVVLCTILGNNLRVFSMLVVTGVISAGAIPILYLFFEGANLGRLAHISYQTTGKLPALAALVAPHALFELTGFALTASAMLGGGLMFCRGNFVANESHDWHQFAQSLFRKLVLAMGLIIVAALVESFFTPEFGLWVCDIVSS